MLGEKEDMRFGVDKLRFGIPITSGPAATSWWAGRFKLHLHVREDGAETIEVYQIRCVWYAALRWRNTTVGRNSRAHNARLRGLTQTRRPLPTSERAQPWRPLIPCAEYPQVPSRPSPARRTVIIRRHPVWTSSNLL